MHRKYANLIGPKVVFFRHQQGWTQEDLVGQLQGRGVRVTRDVIANIETGRCTVSDRTVEALAVVFDVDYNALFPPRPKWNGQYIGLSEPIPTRRRPKHRRPRGPNRSLAKKRSS